MMKTALTIALLVAVMAHYTNGHCFNSDSPECQCKKLLRPEQDKKHFKSVVKSCADQFGFSLPPRRGGGRGGPREKRSPKFLENLPDDVKNCISEAILTDIGALSNGVYTASAVDTSITTNIDNNRDKVTITDEQYNTIIAALSGCTSAADGEVPLAFDIFECIKDACVSALTA